MQDRIISLAIYLYVLARNKLWNNVNYDIMDYVKLKKAWGQGHVGVFITRCNPTICRIHAPRIAYHTQIIGFYVNVYREKKHVNLGNDLKKALISVNDIKASVLWDWIDARF